MERCTTIPVSPIAEEYGVHVVAGADAQPQQSYKANDSLSPAVRRSCYSEHDDEGSDAGGASPNRHPSGRLTATKGSQPTSARATNRRQQSPLDNTPCRVGGDRCCPAAIAAAEAQNHLRNEVRMMEMLDAMREQCDETVRILHGKAKAFKTQLTESETRVASLEKKNKQMRHTLEVQEEQRWKLEEQSHQMILEQQKAINLLQRRLDVELDWKNKFLTQMQQQQEQIQLESSCSLSSSQHQPGGPDGCPGSAHDSPITTRRLLAGRRGPGTPMSSRIQTTTHSPRSDTGSHHYPVIPPVPLSPSTGLQRRSTPIRGTLSGRTDGGTHSHGGGSVFTNDSLNTLPTPTATPAESDDGSRQLQRQHSRHSLGSAPPVQRNPSAKRTPAKQTPGTSSAATPVRAAAGGRTSNTTATGSTTRTSLGKKSAPTVAGGKKAPKQSTGSSSSAFVLAAKVLPSAKSKANKTRSSNQQDSGLTPVPSLEPGNVSRPPPSAALGGLRPTGSTAGTNKGNGAPKRRTTSVGVGTMDRRDEDEEDDDEGVFLVTMEEEEPVVSRTPVKARGTQTQTQTHSTKANVPVKKREAPPTNACDANPQPQQQQRKDEQEERKLGSLYSNPFGAPTVGTGKSTATGSTTPRNIQPLSLEASPIIGETDDSCGNEDDDDDEEEESPPPSIFQKQGKYSDRSSSGSAPRSETASISEGRASSTASAGGSGSGHTQSRSSTARRKEATLLDLANEED